MRITVSPESIENTKVAVKFSGTIAELRELTGDIATSASTSFPGLTVLNAIRTAITQLEKDYSADVEKNGAFD